MTDLHDRLRAELDRRLAVAKAASQARGGSTPSGEHWRWECGSCDTPVEITDVVLLDEFLECPACGSCQLALRSVEEYPTNSVGDLPHFVVGSAEEIRPVDGFHIALHDPADALRRYAGELEVLERHKPTDRDAWRYGITCNGCPNSASAWPCPEIRSLTSRLNIPIDYLGTPG